MAGPGVTVNAAVLTASIGVDRAIEGQVRGAVASDDGFRRFDAYLGALGQRGFLIPAVILGHRVPGREPVVRVGGSATTTWGQGGKHHANLLTV